MSDRGRSAELVEEAAAATQRLADTIGHVSADDLAAPSLLPGWTRAHVLTHVARNADGARNLLLGVRSGRPVRMYASPGTRTADIDAGVSRPAEVIMADALESSRRFVIDAECMPEDAWSTELPLSSGGTEPPRLVAGFRALEMRLREVEFHHVDLDAGYSFAEGPAELLDRLLVDTIVRLGREGLTVNRPGLESADWIVATGGTEHQVAGSAPEMLAWLSGRSSGAKLASQGPLPALPSLG